MLERLYETCQVIFWLWIGYQIILLLKVIFVSDKDDATSQDL